MAADRDGRQLGLVTPDAAATSAAKSDSCFSTPSPSLFDAHEPKVRRSSRRRVSMSSPRPSTSSGAAMPSSAVTPERLPSAVQPGRASPVERAASRPTICPVKSCCSGDYTAWRRRSTSSSRTRPIGLRAKDCRQRVRMRASRWRVSTFCSSTVFDTVQDLLAGLRRDVAQLLRPRCHLRIGRAFAPHLRHPARCCGDLTRVAVGREPETSSGVGAVRTE